MLTIQDAVSEAFSSLKLTPRDGQDQICVSVLEAFLTHQKSIVVVDAPTGSGKSVIGVVVSKALGLLTDPSEPTSVMITATNSLAKQYERDFKASDTVYPLYGAGNYPCTLREEVLKKAFTAESCYKKSRYFYTAVEPLLGDAAEEHCGKCEFAISRSRKATDSMIVTNYAYFIIDRMYMQKIADADPGCGPTTFQKRPLFIFDEAHLINEMFVNHNAIFFSEARSREYLKDLGQLFGEDAPVVANYENTFRIILENIERSTIGPKNVEKFVGMLHRFYSFMHDTFEQRANWSKTEADYDRLHGVRHKYHGLFCKTDDYFKFKYEVAVHCDQVAGELSVKPIFVKECFNHLRSKYNLFLSATLSKEFIYETLALTDSDVEYVRVPYAFNAGDKRVRIPKRDTMLKLNYQTLKDPAVIKRLAELCSIYAGLHPDESGLIVTTSFDLAERIADQLVSPHQVILHKRGERVEQAVTALKQRSSPSVLISPTLFEGIDLPGEESRFQIIAKAPYYSLADKRMSVIMRKHRQIYAMMNIMRLTQGLGRSTRFKGDTSTSYFIDKNITRLFNSKHNLWKGQFSVQKDFQP